jgi:acetyltransferase
MTDPTRTAEAILTHSGMSDKPILASWMGGDTVKKGAEILAQGGIPNFEFPDDAAWAFAKMWTYSHNLLELYETPVHGYWDFLGKGKGKSPSHQAQALIQEIREQGRTLLNEHESKQLLSFYGIPVVGTFLGKSVEEAVQHAKKIGFPVVLKLFSETITHKTDVGGVKLNLQNEDAVAKAFSEIVQSVSDIVGPEHFQGVTIQKMVKLDGYELILGSSIDEQFGPVILFGTGGQLVEVFKDRAMTLPPLTSTLARFLMEKTKIYEALEGVRGRKPVNIPELIDILVRFSHLISENRWIKECDINPLFASPNQIIALDARIVLQDLATKESALPRLSIRPYPQNYVSPVALKNGLSVTLRPILPEDEPLVVAFHKDLSENSVRQRYYEFISLDQRIAHERLVRICFNDYDRDLAIVAEIDDAGTRKIVGLGRLSRIPGTRTAILHMIIRDGYHHIGLGTILLEHLIRCAREEKWDEIIATILSENEGMIKICQRTGFKTKSDSKTGLVSARLRLND